MIILRDEQILHFAIPSFLFLSQMTDYRQYLTIFQGIATLMLQGTAGEGNYLDYCILIGNLCQFGGSKMQETLNWYTLGFDMIFQCMMQLELLERRRNSPYTY